MRSLSRHFVLQIPILLYQVDHGEEIIIDEFTYTVMTDYLRRIHQIAKDETWSANGMTKMILIEDAHDEYERSKTKII